MKRIRIDRTNIQKVKDVFSKFDLTEIEKYKNDEFVFYLLNRYRDDISLLRKLDLITFSTYRRYRKFLNDLETKISKEYRGLK
ncbi:hypothetical protein [Arcobacter aquimarinus]|uniref:hypothetical protein n=1 Tax=Arcobacter aquimarinus TaxID=1315211 RepID=UPI003BB1F765